MTRPRKRHALSTRLWHWTNFGAVAVLFMSGLNISNAHRYLYWGDYGFDPADAWLKVVRFPGWATLPQRYDLAAAREWHIGAAWVFALALLCMWVAMLVNRHFVRDLTTAPGDWSPVRWIATLRAHVRGERHSAGAKFDAPQKIAYGVVLGILLPLLVLTGLAISPGFEPAAPWLVDLLGGRQSARSLHFLAAWGLFAFFVVHVAMVVASNAGLQVEAMLTGGEREEKDG